MVGKIVIIVKPWLFWDGISFIVGGSTSLAIKYGVEVPLSPMEDLTDYSVAWIAIGIVFVAFSLFKKNKEETNEKL